MIRLKENNRKIDSYEGFRMVFAGLFFISFFFYFFLFNRYHLAFQEQIQLFRYSTRYFAEFLPRPGGLSEYAGSFLVQFFRDPAAASIIITLTGILLFLAGKRILAAFGIKGDNWSYFPVIMIAALHSNHMYSISYTLAFLFALFYFILFVYSAKSKTKFIILLVLWPGLYAVTGGYSLVTGALCIIYTLFCRCGRERWLFTIIPGALALLIPFIASMTVYFTGNGNVLLTFIPFFTGSPSREIVIVLLAWFPVILLLTKIRIVKRKISVRIKYFLNAAGFIVILLLSGSAAAYFYDRNTELLLGIDTDIQAHRWEAALKKSIQIREPNRMALHYTNLALFKTGNLGDRLFHYPQSGSGGLWLDWQQDWLIAFFGCGTYYELGYNSEAYRWAYEAMVAKGPNPRSLKILALTSMVDGNLELAARYLRHLKQTLFYRDMAEEYLKMISDKNLMDADAELSSKRSLIINTDFVNSVNPGGRLAHLLREHPGNRMAYEYYMAALLLEKDLDGFAENISRLRDFGYRTIPVHYEEAIAAYMSYSGKNIVPEGYTLSSLTRDRLSAYAEAVYSYGAGNSAAAGKLYGKFGNTYWYYLKFVDHQKPLY